MDSTKGLLALKATVIQTFMAQVGCTGTTTRKSTSTTTLPIAPTRLDRNNSYVVVYFFHANNPIPRRLGGGRLAPRIHRHVRC